MSKIGMSQIELHVNNYGQIYIKKTIFSTHTASVSAFDDTADLSEGTFDDKNYAAFKDETKLKLN